MEWPISWNDVKEKLEAVLPVVGLSMETIMSAGSGATELNSDEYAQIEAAYIMGLPCMIRVVYEGVVYAAAIAKFEAVDDVIYYVELLDKQYYKITRDDGKWVIEGIVE